MSLIRFIRKLRVTVIALCLLFCVVFLEDIANFAVNLKQNIKEMQSSIYRNRSIVDLSDIVPLNDEEDAWYTKYHFIAHAGGGIEGKVFSNSLQAWEESYRNGNRIIDADLAFTSDGELVLRHSWGDNLESGGILPKDSRHWRDLNGMDRLSAEQDVQNFDEFINSKIYFKYDPMTCKMMLEYMNSHEDLYVSCDMKDNLIESYSYLFNCAKENNYDQCLERIIVNLYEPIFYDSLMEIFPFQNIVMRQHYVKPVNYSELIMFCVTHDIHVVNVSSCYLNDKGIEDLHELGFHIYVAITDDIETLRIWHEKGVDGAVTNWLYESMWEYIDQEY